MILCVRDGGKGLFSVVGDGGVVMGFCMLGGGVGKGSEMGWDGMEERREMRGVMGIGEM